MLLASHNLASPPFVSLDSPLPGKFPSFVSFPSFRPGRRRPGSSMGVGGIGWRRDRGEIFRVVRVVVRCRRERDSEEDPAALEAEIMEFMKGSDKPNLFPTKEQLLDAGREDLVEAISQRGGWLSLGWDLGCEDGSGYSPYDIEFEEESEHGNGKLELDGRDDSGPSPLDSSHSRVSLESSSESHSGIEGILSRLEKERKITFGGFSRDRGDNELNSVDNVKDGRHHRMPTDETVAGLGERIKPNPSISNERIINGSRANMSGTGSVEGTTGQPLIWRVWSAQRAGFSENDFEAAEIDPLRDRSETVTDVLKYDATVIREGGSLQVAITENSSSPGNEISHDHIKSRLQHLEAEVSTVLQSLRSKSIGDDQKNSVIVSKDLRELSDAWEFQENEVMNARDKLRSMRAQLAVLEGKMALAIIDAQKTLEEKQKRIDETRRAMRLLRSACIVWPNSASEVLLAGSFDGWTTQRRMERSSTGVFSLRLKLYPGRYEIKFIVDGAWRVDPLRPIVNNNGYENNLLIIT